MSDRIGSAVHAMMEGGKVGTAVIGPRTMLQVSGLDGVVAQTVELLLPPGYSARPVEGADVLLACPLGSRDQMVAIGGDNANVDPIPDLAPGEFGLRLGEQTIVMRNGFVELKTNTYVKITATEYVEIDTPLLKVSGDVQDNFGTNVRTMATMRSIYDIHQHPNVQRGAALTDPPVQTE